MGIPILGKMIADRTLAGIKLVLDSITGAEIADNAIGNNNLSTDSVGATQLDQTAVDKVLEGKYLSVKKQVENFTTSASTSDDVTHEVYDALAVIKTDGSASQAGAVTSGVRTALKAYPSSDKIIDDGDEVYCELTSSIVNSSDGATWTEGLSTITSISALQVGDIVKPDLRPDSEYYKITNIPSANTFQLDRVYTAQSGYMVANILSWTLSYYKDVSNVKTAHTMDGSAISFKFKESMTLKDVPSAKFAEEDTGDVSEVIHEHDSLYTKTTDLQKTGATDSGADYINVYTGGLTNISPADDSLQTVFEDLDAAIATLETEPSYTNYPQYEVVATENVMPALDHTPKDDSMVQVWINGIKATYTSHYTFSAGVGTWLPGAGNSNYTLAVGDRIYYNYPTLESNL
jgi:hypothetical protein